MSAPAAGARILLVGRAAPVMETVSDELRALGLNIVGSIHPETVAEDHDARQFDLAALGGGVAEPLRGRIKAALAAANPDLRLLDVEASRSVRQILEALGETARPGVDLEAYFARIGYRGPRTPDLATLTAIHARHIAAIPFESIDAWLGRGIDLDPAAVDAKLIGARRGGYCFEHNGLLQRVLAALGYDVVALGARVLFGRPPGGEPPPRTHMALKVMVDGVAYLVDAGFGRSTPAAPLRLDTAEPQPTLHEPCRLFPYGGTGVYLLQQREGDGWISLYSFELAPQVAADFHLANWYTATNPASMLRRGLVVALTRADERLALVNGRLTVRWPDGTAEVVVLDADGIAEVLETRFGLPVDPSWHDSLAEAAATPL